MTRTVRHALADDALIGRLLLRIAEDLGTLLGCELRLGPAQVERATTRPAAAGGVHISFRLAFTPEGEAPRLGALLLPLPEALTMAAHFLMAPEEVLPTLRAASEPDLAQKEALLELGKMIANAGRTALAQLGVSGLALRFDGCQGVRAGVRPAFAHAEGSPLIVGRAPAKLGPFPGFELLVMLPVLD